MFVDASQYAPHKCPNLQECDVIAYCGHKMGAPFGCGILAGRKKLLAYDNMSITGGGNVIYVDENNNPYYKELPYIHEAGTPNGIGAVAVATAHKVLFDEIGEKELHSHSSELNQAIRTCSQDLKKNGYEVFFADTTENRTPIMVINNKLISNKETVIKLNSVIGDMDKNVFVREGAFCAYRLLEKINPNLRDIKEKIVDGKLDSRYSLIRLSAGVINTPEDIYYASRKLIKINENL